MYLRDTIDNFKESTRATLQEKTNKKSLTLLKGRQLVINTFDSRIFCMKTVSVVNNDDNDYYTYVDLLYLKGTLMPRTSTTHQ